MKPAKPSEANRNDRKPTKWQPDLLLSINASGLHAGTSDGKGGREESKQTEQELLRQTRQFTAATEVAHMAISTLDLDTLLRSCVELIRDKFGFYHASVFLTEPDSNLVVLRESTGEAGRELKASNHKLAVGSNSL